MAAFSSLIAAAGLAAGAAGTAVQFAGQKQAQKGAERAEKLRQSQMELDNTRSRRQIIRQAVAARASALSGATSQGAQESSGYMGGQQQITSEAGASILAVNQNQQLGQNMFSANRQISRGQGLASFGSGLSSLGGGLVQNSETIGRIGNYFTGRQSPQYQGT